MSLIVKENSLFYTSLSNSAIFDSPTVHTLLCRAVDESEGDRRRRLPDASKQAQDGPQHRAEAIVHTVAACGPAIQRCGARHSHKEASMSRLMVTAIAVGCTFGSFAAQAAHFSFTTLDDPADPTFNQLLGINDSG